MTDLTRQQRQALGAAACYAAVSLAAGQTRKDRERASRLKSKAAELLKSCGLEPTDLKDLGLDLIESAR